MRSQTKSLFVNPFLWIACRFCMGFFTAGLWIVIESWLLMVAGKENKGTVLSYYMIAFYAAQAIGQFILTRVSALSLIPFSIASLFISLSVVPVALTKSKSPAVEGRSLLSPLKLMRISPFGFLSSFGSGLIMGAFFGLAPVFAYKIGMNNNDIVTYMGVTIIGGFVLQWPLGRLSDKVSRRSVLIGVSLITSSIALLMALASLAATDILFILSVLFGGFSFTMYPMSISYANDYLDSKDLVAATGGLLVAYGIGCVIGPLLAPVAMQIIGPSGLYVYFAFIAATVGVFGLMRRKYKKPIPISEQAKYVSVPRTTPKASELDPRGDENLSKPVTSAHFETVERRLEQVVQEKVEQMQVKTEDKIISDHSNPEEVEPIK